MDVIIQWVTQIIIFILLATIVDLLIPQTTLKKYINLVVGLILILIFLKPVFYVFNLDISQALNQSYEQLEQQETTLMESEKWMEFQKKDIQASQDAYILEQMTDKLKELADPPLQNELSYEITDIQYAFGKGEKMKLENMETLTVYIKSSGRQEGIIKQVDKVDINADPNNEPEEEFPRAEIKDILAKTWEMDTERLEIAWGGEA